MTVPSSSPAVPQTVTSAAVAVEKPYTPLEIDVSCSSPLLLMFASAAIWLAFGTLLHLIASIKLHSPGFFANVAWLSFGRVRPAGMDALLYGFASQAAMGITLWLTCRLGAVTLCCKGPVILATAFWNLGVTIGVLSVLGGGSSGFAWLEMPKFVAVILFASYALVGLCILVTFYNRAERSLYVSQWYLLAALFWFPWIYSAANLLLLYWPVRGVLQAFINAWFTNNFLTLWLGSVALANLFYFIPKLLNRPLYSSYIAGFGFWTYLLAAGWTGSIQLIGGPLPSWMIAIGTSAGILLILPTIAVGFNWYMTGGRIRFDRADRGNIVLRYIQFGAFSYFVASICGILLAVYKVSEVTQFSLVPLALVYLIIFGFFGMTAFAAIYYIVPRATRLEWPCQKAVQLHYLSSAAGIGILFVALLLGGIIQGYRLNETTAYIVNVTRGTIPFIGLGTLGFLLLLVGQLAFLKNLFTLLHRQASPVRAAAVGLFIPETARAGGKP
ncbi:MAG TPA: cbb3-type cytochrome c oxidase subunit I [Verrucomicrobiae bacterium]|nr:cbb3-type cytochrome c oxidase subunit I [Verrucomicrobiae bacterium]